MNGNYFKELREKNKLSKEELSKILKISIAQIDLLENGSFNNLPKVVLKNILERYKKFFKIKEEIRINQDNIGENISFKTGRKIFDLNLGYLFLTILAIIFLIQVLEIALPPKINILSPKDKSIFNNREIKIEGYTDPRSTFYINKRQIPIDNKGYFSVSVLLNPGSNKFVLESENFFKIKNSKTVEIFYFKY